MKSAFAEGTSFGLPKRGEYIPSAQSVHKNGEKRPPVCYLPEGIKAVTNQKLPFQIKTPEGSDPILHDVWRKERRAGNC